MALGAEIGEVKGQHRIVLTHEFHQKDQIQSIPGAKWSNNDPRAWHLPVSWVSCLALRTEFGDELEIGDQLLAWATQERYERVEPATRLRELVQIADDTPTSSNIEQALNLHDELGLFAHQTVGAAFMATSEQCLVADEQGTGKTAQAITALRILHREGRDVFPALVVAPNTVKKTWEREFARWWPGLEVQVVKGTAAARRKQLATPAHVYVVNWELLAKHSRLAAYGNYSLARCVPCGGIDNDTTEAKCEVHPRELNGFTFRTVIADECHRAKEGKTKQTRALWYVSQDAVYRYALTGTPVQDTITDLWAILRFVAPYDYPAKTAFLNRYAETGFNLWGQFTVYGIRESMRDEFYGSFNTRMRRMLKEIVLPFLPPIVRETRSIEMNPTQKKAYRQMLKETIAELAEGDLIALTALSRATRLLQFSSAYAKLEVKELEDGRREEHVRLSMPSNKIDAFMTDIQAGDFGDSSIVVFAQSRQLIEMLSEQMTKKEIEHGLVTGAISTDERQRHIDDFQNGKTKFILITVSAGGEGLTLTAANVAVFLQRSWSSIAMRQAEARMHRPGSEQHESILIVDYVSEDTIEEDQIIALNDKYARIESIVRDRELLAKLLSGKKIKDDEVTQLEPIQDDELQEAS